MAVIGAGAFGGWAALELLRRGARVTLVDGWGPGNSRASSGGDTRVIRHTYRERIYVDMVSRALHLWQEHQRRWSRPLLRQTGVLWMVQDNETYERAALPHLEAAGIEHEILQADEIGRRHPQICMDGIRWGIHEPGAGYLLARRACEAVLDGFLAEGGEYLQAWAVPGPMEGGEMRGIRLLDGTHLQAERHLFAGGPWLGQLLPASLARLVRPTRQEVFTFGPPAGDSRFAEGALPVWAVHGERLWYGIPGGERRGFKVADDTKGNDFDPTHGDRTPSKQGLARARAFMELRFPAMQGAPLLEARVCQYENSPDDHFILDRLPQAANVWLLGGGSGHGFKHGPALGELAAAVVLEERPVEAFFSLSRLS